MLGKRKETIEKEMEKKKENNIEIYVVRAVGEEERRAKQDRRLLTQKQVDAERDAWPAREGLCAYRVTNRKMLG